MSTTAIPRKASEVDERAILEFLADRQGKWSTWFDYKPRPDNTVMHVVPEGTHPRVVLAKMRALIKRGLSGGCDCGCRGDFEITDKGLALIGRTRTTKYNGY